MQEQSIGIYRLKPATNKPDFYEVWVNNRLFGWYRHPGKNNEDYEAGPGHTVAELKSHLTLFASQKNLQTPPSNLTG